MQKRTQTSSFGKNASRRLLPSAARRRFTDCQNLPTRVDSILCCRLKPLSSDPLRNNVCREISDVGRQIPHRFKQHETNTTIKLDVGPCSGGHIRAWRE